MFSNYNQAPFDFLLADQRTSLGWWALDVDDQVSAQGDERRGGGEATDAELERAEGCLVEQQQPDLAASP